MGWGISWLSLPPMCSPEQRPRQWPRVRRAVLVTSGVAVALVLLCTALILACAVYAKREARGDDDVGGIQWSAITGDDTSPEPGFGWLLSRSLSLSVTLAPLLSLSPLALLSSTFCRHVFYPLIAQVLGSGGPALQKWGQWSATRPDMFPQDLCDTLRYLHSKVPSHSWRHTRRTVEAAFGVPLAEVFDEFRHEPVASGSIAQVHLAVLRSTGEQVAVKVRHPNVMDQLWIDIQLMHGVAWVLDNFVPALQFLHLRSTVAQFSHTIAIQARLDLEAKYLEQMRRNFASWGSVHIPRPLFSAPTLIVETFEPGRTVGSAIQMGIISPHDARYIVNRGQDIFLKMLLTDRFMHADLHPGNILVDLTAGTGNREPTIVLVDLGMVVHLTEEEQLHFVGLLRALGFGDGRKAAEHVLHFTAPGFQACVGPCADAFAEDMVELFGRICRGFGTNVDFGEVLRGILQLVRKHEVTISANYATMVVNALCLDGMATGLEPEYNLLDGCAPLLRLSVLSRTRPGMVAMRLAYPFVAWIKAQSDAGFRRRLSREDRRPPGVPHGRVEDALAMVAAPQPPGLRLPARLQHERSEAQLNFHRRVRDPSAAFQAWLPFPPWCGAGLVGLWLLAPVSRLPAASQQQLVRWGRRYRQRRPRPPAP